MRWSCSCADQRKICSMKLLMLVLLGLAGCSSWHWEKRGALDGDYTRDEIFCKQHPLGGCNMGNTTADGVVTNASVRRMHACMQAKGWQKVDN